LISFSNRVVVIQGSKLKGMIMRRIWKNLIKGLKTYQRWSLPTPKESSPTANSRRVLLIHPKIIFPKSKPISMKT